MVKSIFKDLFSDVGVAFVSGVAVCAKNAYGSVVYPRGPGSHHYGFGKTFLTESKKMRKSDLKAGGSLRGAGGSFKDAV